MGVSGLGFGIACKSTCGDKHSHIPVFAKQTDYLSYLLDTRATVTMLDLHYDAGANRAQMR